MADEAARKKIEEGKKKLEALKAKKAAKAAADKGGGDDAPEESPPVPAAQAPAAPPEEAPGGGSAAQFAGAHSGHTAGEQDAAAQREISALKDALRAREQQHAKSQEQLAGAHKAQTDAVAVCPGRFGSTRDAEAERMEAEELDRELEKIFGSLEGEKMIARPDLDHLARHSEERSSRLLSAAGHALPETYDPDGHHAAPMELCWGTRVSEANESAEVRPAGQEDLGRLSRSKKAAPLRLCPWKVRGGSCRAPFSCSPPFWAAAARRQADAAAARWQTAAASSAHRQPPNSWPIRGGLLVPASPA